MNYFSFQYNCKAIRLIGYYQIKKFDKLDFVTYIK